MRSSFYFLSLAFLLIVFTSCQKDTTISDARSLEGTWAVTAITSNRAYDFNGDGRIETDIYGSYNSCGRDIVTVFEPSGYGQMRQGCNAPWQNITWQLQNNNRMLNIVLPDDVLNLQLQQFDDYTIRGTDQVQINGMSFDITYTFQRR